MVDKMCDRVVVCCLGYWFEVYHEMLANKYKIIGLADNDKDKIGKIFYGITCYSITEAIALHPDRIIVASRDWIVLKEVSDQIKEITTDINVIYITELFSKHYIFKNSQYKNCFKDEFGNECVFDDNLKFECIDITFVGTDNMVHIASGVVIEGTFKLDVFGDGNYVEIGQKTTIRSLSSIVSEHGKITIGSDCMFANGIEIYQSSFHPIFDKATGKRRNVSRDVRVGDHVWIGSHVCLMPGFEIGNGGVVGYGSISSAGFGENVEIAGSPARVIKEGVLWECDMVGLYGLDDISDSLMSKKRFDSQNN